MKASRSGWVAVAVVAALLIAGGTARGQYTWISASDGNWSDTNNWEVSGSTPAAPPNSSHNIVINDVASGMRTITLDATPTGYGATYWRYRSIVINQSTAGATNRLLFSNSLRMDSSEYQTGTSFNAPDGTVIMDTGTHIWEWNSMNTGGTRTFGPHVIINGSGGSKQNQRSWHNQPTPVIQGTVNVSGGTVTAFLSGGSGTNLFDTGSILNITGAGVLNSVRPFDLKVTITGDGTGGLRARETAGTTRFDSGTSLGSQLKLMSGTIQVDEGAYFNGQVYLNTENFDYRSASPNTVLTNVTIAPVGGGSRDNTGRPGGTAPYNHGNGYTAPSLLEVTANADTSTNWKLGKLTNRRLNINDTYFADRGAIRLTDRYDNDPTSTDPEYLLVTRVEKIGGYEVLYLSDATRGYDVHVDGPVGNWNAWSGLQLGDIVSGAESTIRFLTPGGTFTLAQYVYLSHGARLNVVGPAAISQTAVGAFCFTAGGTLDFNGNLFINVQNYTPGTATIDAYGTNIVYGTVGAASTNAATDGARLVIKGHLQDVNTLYAGGDAKLWVSDAPKFTPPSRIDIEGNYLTWVWNNEGEYIWGQFRLERKATVAVAGNFTQRQFRNDWIGDSLINNWRVDTSPDCGSLVFNGGGSVTQTWETMSSVATVFTGLNFYAQSATPVAGTTVTGATSNAEATIGKVFNDLLKLTNVTGTFTSDEVLNFSDGKTARAYAAQSVRPDLTDTAYPYPTVSIGEAGGNPALVRLVNAYNHRRYQAVSASPAQIVRNLIVTSGSTFDLRAQQAIVSVGEAAISGLVTNSVAGGNLTLSDGATLKFETGGVIDVDTLTIGAGCTVDFNQAEGSYFRVNGNQKAAFDTLIASGQLVDNGGGVVKTSYSADDAHTTVYLGAPPSGTLFLLR